MAQETLRENKMGTMPENKLLLSMAVPMMISMLVQALYNIVDSIFVSRICEDALTAVSMAFPLQNIIISIAVGFGVGINALLSRALGQKNAERVNQVAVNGLLLALLSYLLVLVAGLVGIRAYMRAQTDIESIVEYGITYLNICVLCSFGVFCEITFERFLQATGRTIYSMVTQLVGAITNIILDPILIFGLLGFPEMGVTGAALATSLGYIVGAGMILGYLGRRRNVVRLCRVKTSRKSMRLTLRNVGYMCRLGLSTFLCEGAIAMMMFAGNYVFIRYLGEDGVAAFSIACYFFPIIFMVYNAIGQSAQPILSYNFGAGNGARVRKAFRLALLTAVAAGLGFFGLTALFSRWISCPACAIAVRGLPLFASGFVFFAVNIVSIGYFQSVERPRPAMAVTVLRGFVFMAACFFGLPLLLGVEGIWLAVPLAEALTFAVVAAIYGRTRLKSAF